MITVAVLRSPEICLTAEENHGKLHLLDRLMKGLCDQSSHQNHRCHHLLSLVLLLDRDYIVYIGAQLIFLLFNNLFVFHVFLLNSDLQELPCIRQGNI